MESKNSILNKSESPEECKINNSNKELDGELYMFLPKNILEEISDKKEVPPKNTTENKKKTENNKSINNQILINNNPQNLNFITNIQNINTHNSLHFHSLLDFFLPTYINYLLNLCPDKPYIHF